MNIWCTYIEIQAEWRDETMVDFRDQSGAAEAVWAYPTGPKSENTIRWRVIVLWIAVLYLCAACVLCLCISLSSGGQVWSLEVDDL